MVKCASHSKSPTAIFYLLCNDPGAVFTMLSIGGGNVKIKNTIISKLGHYHLDDVWYFEIHVQKYIFRMKKSSFAKLLNPKEKLLIVLLLHHFCLEPKFVCACVCLV